MKLHILFLLFVLMTSESFAQRSVGNPAQARRARESLQQLARDKQEEADEARAAFRYVNREPYVPRLYDYGIGLGGAWGERNYYSIGGNLGFHLSTCIFSGSQTCQQYFDIIFGVNGRDAHTHYLGLGSLRWQFVSFPSPWSPLVRVMAGLSNQIIPGSVKQHFTYGAGLGITTYLHPKADIRIEYQLYHADVPYSQLMFYFQFKMEKWVEYFAEKLHGIGIGTTGEVMQGAVELTGKAVESTVDITGKAIEGTVDVTKQVTGLKEDGESKKTNGAKKESGGGKNEKTPEVTPSPRANP